MTSHPTLPRLPTFLICGAEKAGTTSLFRYLGQHPEVAVPSTKEIHFFSLHWERGVPWYAGHFSGPAFEGARALGEASPSYLTRRDVPERIKAVVPDARLVFILRHPVDRAYSAYWQKLRDGGQDPAESFSRAIETDEGHRKYVLPGRYATHLARFLAHFPRDQLHIALTEDLVRDPRATLSSLFAFLGVDPGFLPDTSQVHNPRKVPRGRPGGALVRGVRQVKQRLRPVVPVGISRATKRIRRKLHDAVLVEKEVPGLPDADRHRLSELYQPDIRQLSALVGRDRLRVWGGAGPTSI